MDTSVRYTPKTCKIRNPKFVFGQHHRARSRQEKKLARCQSVLVYWCTACDRNQRLLFFSPELVYWCTACNRVLQLLFCFLEHNGRTDRQSVVTPKSSSVPEGLQDFHQDTRRDPKYPPSRSVRRLFFLSSCTFFWSCMVLHKTTQHDMFF
jgi:hypothetical protein